MFLIHPHECFQQHVESMHQILNSPGKTLSGWVPNRQKVEWTWHFPSEIFFNDLKISRSFIIRLFIFVLETTGKIIIWSINFFCCTGREQNNWPLPYNVFCVKPLSCSYLFSSRAARNHGEDMSLCVVGIISMPERECFMYFTCQATFVTVEHRESVLTRFNFEAGREQIASFCKTMFTISLKTMSG